MEEADVKEEQKIQEEKEKEVEAVDEEEMKKELAETPEEVGVAEETAEAEVVEEEKPAPVEEEKARPPREEKEEEEEIIEERIYTIPLGKAWIMPPKKRAPRAMRMIKEFITKHMKLEKRGEEEEVPQRLIISNELNERVWGRGIEKPPRKVRIRATKDKEGNVTVYLAEGD